MEYIRVNAPDEEALFAAGFKWLDKWILWFPSYVVLLPSGKRRFGNRTNLCIALFIFLFVISMFCFEIWSVFEFSDMPTIVSMCWLALTIIFEATRIFSLIYFYFFFDYPWHRRLDTHKRDDIDVIVTSFMHRESDNIIFRNFSFILKSFLVTASVAEIASLVTVETMSTAPDPTGMVISNVYALVYMYVAEIPNILALAIYAVVCYICCRYLEQIQGDIDLDTVDGKVANLNQAFFAYKTLYGSFKKEYNFFLKYCIIVHAISYCVDLWFGSINTTSLMNFPHTFGSDPWVDLGLGVMVLSAYLYAILLVSVYIVSSSMLSETFQSFQESLWRKKEECIGEESALPSQQILTSMLLYTAKYPTHIAVGGLVLTKRNIALFVVTFIATKVIAEIVLRVE